MESAHVLFGLQLPKAKQKALSVPAYLTSHKEFKEVDFGESSFLLHGSSHQKLHTAPYSVSHSTFPPTVEQLHIQMTLVPSG